MIRFATNRRAVGITYPPDVDSLLRSFFAGFGDFDSEGADEVLDIRHATDGTYTLHHKDLMLWEELTQASLPTVLRSEIENLLAATSVDAVVRCSAVKADERSVLILGPAGSGKTTLACWLIEQGYGYLADNFVSLATGHANVYDARDAISPLPLPMALHANDDAMQMLNAGEILGSWDDRVFLAPQAATRADNLIERCGLVLVPQFHEGAQFEVAALSQSELQFLLAQALHPVQRLTSFNSERLSSFARAVSAVSVRFSNYDQLAGNLDRFIDAYLSRGAKASSLADFCQNWRNPPSAATATTETMPASTPQPQPAVVTRQRRKLTIGMATYDDFDGVYFTLQSLRMHHPETVDDVEYLVIDNNPDGACAEPLKYLEKKIPNYRYIPVRERSGTAVRDYVMAEAASEFVLNLDCHVLLVPGAVARLMDYFEANSDTNDLLQGPLVWDELNLVSTHMNPTWKRGFFGDWGLDQRGVNPDNPPFEIPMHGLGLYACRRAAWPGYNRKFRGFGGEEGYIHEKFRQAGGRTLCLPFMRWLHRFSRPLGVPYKISWDDRMRNYILGSSELGLPIDEAVHHFREILGKEADRIAEAVKAEISEGAISHPGGNCGVTDRAREKEFQA